MSPTPVTPLPAATLLLLRDSIDGIQVLMTTRHAEAGFAGGALVFPGGKVNADDERYASRHAEALGIDAAAAAFRAAAIRESYEETEILLAGGVGERTLMSGDAMASLHRRHGGKPDFPALLASGEIELRADLLVPFAHWITPKARPKRFDTHFFLAPAPSDQVARHDGREAVDSRWVTPAEALAQAEADHIKIVFVTRMNLRKLGRSRTVAEALDTARRTPIVTVVPERANGPDGPVFRIPADAGYGAAEIAIGNIPIA